MEIEPAIAARNELAAAIDEAWREFGRYHFGRPLEVCRCDVCVSDAQEADLLSIPVHALPASVLQAYTDSAHESTPYADDQYRALLPRYFELCAKADWPAGSAELVFRRLYHSRWRDWPASEVTVIERFFAALFAAWRHDWGSLGDTPAARVLGLALYAGGSVEALLARWDADRSLAAALKLAHFIVSISWGKRKQRLGAFWEDSPEVEERVVAWLRRPETRTTLTDAFFLTEDADEQCLISTAELVI
jgi:hypothetical protein